MKFFRHLALVLFLAFPGLAVPAARGSVVSYAGLVAPADIAPGQSGFFIMDVWSDGFFEGKVVVGKLDGFFSGQFNNQGAAEVIVKVRTGTIFCWCDPDIEIPIRKAVWNLSLQLTNNAAEITGAVQFRQGGFPDSTLFGKRCSFTFFHPAPQTGRYTFVVPGTGDASNTNLPTGDGFGAMKIDFFGTMLLEATLADGSRFSQTTLVCDDGSSPVFASLYNGKGMIQGWLTFTNLPDADLNGDLVWVKSSRALPAFYPAGFTNDAPVIGSRYVVRNPVLNFTDGIVAFQGGNLAAPFTNAVALNGKTVVNASTNRLAMKLTPGTGWFNGTVEDPATHRLIPFKGAVLQKRDEGFGFFPDTPRSGEVIFDAAP